MIKQKISKIAIAYVKRPKVTKNSLICRDDISGKTCKDKKMCAK